MKYLYLLRHAKAEDKAEGKRDYDRELTAKGRRDARAIGRRLRSLEVRPGLVVSSPAPRALETAQAAAGELGHPVSKILRRAAMYEGGVRTLLAIVRRVSGRYGSLMLVGHNPAFLDFAGYLLNRELGGFPKSAVVCIAFDSDSWKGVRRHAGRLVFFEKPRG